MGNESESHLTPEQAADVIRYYNADDNAVERSHGAKDKISFGHSAIRSSLGRHSILPDGSPTMTPPEAAAGLAHLEQEEERKQAYAKYMATPPRGNADRDWAERAAGEDLEKD